MIGQRGQAFSVFKILIAAIVALAILGLLLNIMGLISFNPANEPETAVKDLVKKAYSSPYAPASSVVTFSYPDHYQITKAQIKEAASLTDEQIVFVSPNSQSISALFSAEDFSLKLENSVKSKEALLYVICGANPNDISQSVPEVFGNLSAQDIGDVVCYITVGPKK
ncbi:MAG: hypothetical protein PHH82_00855 [Candidatus ainarchaeum sp.]|nr:hypothetical protein [Candidatus ainarchaeum sp.]